VLLTTVAVEQAAAHNRLQSNIKPKTLPNHFIIIGPTKTADKIYRFTKPTGPTSAGPPQLDISPVSHVVWPKGVEVRE
jgi:hypothetical protein